MPSNLSNGEWGAPYLIILMGKLPVGLFQNVLMRTQITTSSKTLPVMDSTADVANDKAGVF